MGAVAHVGSRSFPNNSAIARNLRVMLSAGNLLAATALGDELGILNLRTLAADAVGSVRMPSSSESIHVTASGAITQYTNVYPDAAGKVTGTDNGPRWGLALEAASGDGSIIECLRLPEPVQGGGLIQETVVFTENTVNTTFTGTVVVPAGATIVDIIVDAVALWNDGTAASLIVGDETDPDGFYTAVDLKATDLLAQESLSFAVAGGVQGAYIMGTLTHVTDRYRVASRTVVGVVAATDKDGTTGITRMTVIYALPNTVKNATASGT